MISEFHAPFSPVIMVSMVPDRFVEIVNERADIVLNSEVTFNSKDEICSRFL